MIGNVKTVMGSTVRAVQGQEDEWLCGGGTWAGSFVARPSLLGFTDAGAAAV